MHTNTSVQYESRSQRYNDIVRDAQRYELAQISQGKSPEIDHSHPFWDNLWQHLKAQSVSQHPPTTVAPTRKRHA